ncbi:type II toxin-antitoxin system Phd/YefM family antitoxin [Kribbella albertanoniae]|nr:type II toxin-antitoxin system prevent-host-death family antitoxin [Kribbella albertanoniae]
MDDLMDIGIKELRDGLSRHLAYVREGHTITVTDHGKPVAQISPVSKMSRLQQMIAAGEVRPPLRPKRPVPPPIKTKGTVSDLITEDRE